MEKTQNELTGDSGWKEETDKHKEGILAFLRKYFSKPFEEQNYSSFIELHVSGSAIGLLEKDAEKTSKLKLFTNRVKLIKLQYHFKTVGDITTIFIYRERL